MLWAGLSPHLGRRSNYLLSLGDLIVTDTQTPPHQYCRGQFLPSPSSCQNTSNFVNSSRASSLTLKSCLCQYSDGSPDHFSYFIFVSTNMAEIWQIFLKGSKSSWSWLSIRSQSIILGLTIFWNLLWMNFKMIFNKSLKENWELKFYFYQ